MTKYDEVKALVFKNKKDTTRNRLKSKVVWVSISATILMLIGHLGLYKKVGITEDSLKLIIDAILNILVIAGILNNPSDSEEF